MNGDPNAASKPPSHPPDARDLEDAGPVFAHLDEADRAALASYLEELEFEPGADVLREEGSDRAVFFVLAGRARITRRGMQIGGVARGAHFGELALVANRPRAASVTATTALRVAVLSLDRFLELAQNEPALALRLVQSLFTDVAEKLVEMTDSVGALLRDRSLPRRAGVDVTLLGERRTVRTGTRLDAIVPHVVDGQLVVAALVDRKAVSLCTPIASDCTVDPLTLEHWEGHRVFRRTQALVLLEAAHRLGLEVSLGHSVGFAQRVSLMKPPAQALDALAARLEREMQQVVREDRTLLEEWWSVDEARSHFEQAGWVDLAQLLEIWREPAVPLVSFGSVYALRLGPVLARSEHLGVGLRVLADNDGLLMVYADPPRPDDGDETLRSVPPKVSSSQLLGAERASLQTHATTKDQDLWLDALGITSVGTFNRACIRGDVSQLIRVSEGFQEKRLSRIADEILRRGRSARVICIAGPSSSGKTTFINRLQVQLQVNGIQPIGLSLDDYYVDRHLTPRDEGGDYDYETVNALRADLLQAHLTALVDGQRVKTARYDFQTGISDPSGGPELSLSEDSVLLLEGIHGLNPNLLGNLPGDSVYRVFVCPLTQLPFDRLSRVHVSDVRLLRRIVRDRHTRGATAAMNIARWSKVRDGERKYIFPYQHHADVVFDSSLIYEPSVLKVFAERYLLEVSQSDPAYTTAFRLLALLDRFVSIYPDHVPPTSILREFIGARGFER